MLWLNGTVFPLNTEEDWYLCERSEDSAKNTTEMFIFFSIESFYITQQSTYPWEVFFADLFAIFKAIYRGNCMWFNLPRLTAPFIWFREFELNCGYLMTYCLFRKISGREIAGVWKLSWWPLTEVQDIFKDGAKCRRVIRSHHYTEMVC